MDQVQIVKDAWKAVEAVIDGRAEWLPDYSGFRYRYADLLSPFPDADVQRFYEGGLAVLSVLGKDETLTHEETIKLARRLTHECKRNITY